MKMVWKRGQPECLWGCCKNWPCDCAMECCVYSNASEKTGIEKSVRYNLKVNEIIPIIIKDKTTFLDESDDNREILLFKYMILNLR